MTAVDPLLPDGAAGAPRYLVPATRTQSMGLANQVAQGAVLLLSRAADTEMDIVGHALSAVGVPWVVLDVDAAPSHTLALSLGSGELVIGEQAVRPLVTWSRMPPITALPRADDEALHAHRRVSWAAMLSELAQCGCYRVNGAIRELGRLEQLKAAAGLGVAVPETVVLAGESGNAIPASWDRVVVKALGPHFIETEPHILSGVFPRTYARSAIRDQLFLAPTMVQRYVEHDDELRIFAVAGRLFAFRVIQQGPGSIWTMSDKVRVEETDVPASVVDTVAPLVDHWSLDFGAFDVLAAPDGITFLEVNLDASWAWYEGKAQARSVSTAVALHLATRFRHLRMSEGEAGGS